MFIKQATYQYTSEMCILSSEMLSGGNCPQKIRTANMSFSEMLNICIYHKNTETFSCIFCNKNRIKATKCGIIKIKHTRDFWSNREPAASIGQFSINVHLPRPIPACPRHCNVVPVTIVHWRTVCYLLFPIHIKNPAAGKTQAYSAACSYLKSMVCSPWLKEILFD